MKLLIEFHEVNCFFQFFHLDIVKSVVTCVPSATASHHHGEHYHKPYYSYQYGVQAYGPGYHGHGDPGPLHWKHSEHRDGYNTEVAGVESRTI